MSKKLMIGAVVTVLFSTIPGMAAEKVVHKRDLTLVTEDGISWYTTGVGADTREVSVKGFPLKLIFANVKGELLAAVEVSLSRGDRSMGTVKNAGPWLFLDAPAGKYDVRAKVGARQVVRKGIQIPAKGTEIITIHFPLK